MKYIVVWCETKEDVKTLIKQASLLYPDVETPFWINQYLKTSLHNTLPAYIGWDESLEVSAHQPLYTPERNLLQGDAEDYLGSRELIYNRFYTGYTDIPIEVIKNLEKYPEYFI